MQQQISVPIIALLDAHDKLEAFANIVKINCEFLCHNTHKLVIVILNVLKFTTKYV